MDKVVKHKTMYRDMINILKESGLADSLNSEIIKVHQWVEDVILSPYLKKGRFYLASWGEGEPFRYVFYVNPVDWFQKDSIGLVYIGWNGLLQMLERKLYNPMAISNKGWNNGLSDIAAIEDYRGLTLYNRTIAEAKKEEETYDFFREAGYTFYELPNINSNTQLGVFNWWW